MTDLARTGEAAGPAAHVDHGVGDADPDLGSPSARETAAFFERELPGRA